LHQRGMIHGDVKLDNTMFVSESDLSLVLIDYGLVHHGCLPKGGGGCSSSCRGTPLYMMPAICLGSEGYSYEVDFWSWGILATRMFLGEHLIGVKRGRQLDNRTYNFTRFDQWAEHPGSTLAPWIPLLKLIFKDDGRRLAQRRSAMTSPKPEDHPILGHPVWLQDRDGLPDAIYMHGYKKSVQKAKIKFSKIAKYFNSPQEEEEEVYSPQGAPNKFFDVDSSAYKAEIRKFWAEICQKYASNTAKPLCRGVDDEYNVKRPTTDTVPGLCPSETPNATVVVDFLS